jgi:hypothetical protein
VRESGLAWTFLQPNSFMSNTLQWVPQLRAGNVITAPFADVLGRELRFEPQSNDDARAEMSANMPAEYAGRHATARAGSSTSPWPAWSPYSTPSSAEAPLRLWRAVLGAALGVAVGLGAAAAALSCVLQLRWQRRAHVEARPTDILSPTPGESAVMADEAR